MNFFDQFDAAPTTEKAGNFFDQFDDGYKKPDEPGDTWRGFKTSFQQLPQLGYGILAGAGAAAESVVGEGGIATGVKKAGVKGYTEWGDKIAAEAKPSDSIDYSWEQAKQGDFGALVDWLQHGIGYVGGQGLQMLATAGIGAVGGKVVAGTAAKQIAEGMVAKEAAKLAATGIAAEEAGKIAVVNVASKFANIGMNTALGGAAVGMEGGEIFGGLTQQADKDGRILSGAELGKAFGATLAAGGLEFVGDKLGLDIVLGKSKFLKPAEFVKGPTGRATRGLIAGGLQAPIEAATEYGQTLLEEYGQGHDPTSDESLKQAREAAWLGALGGTVIGGVGGAIQGAKERPAPKPITEGVDKIVGAQSVDEAIAAAAQAVSGKPAEPTPAERIAAVKASVDMDAIRAKYGDDSATEFLNSLSQAQNPRVPGAVREKHLQAVETLLFELNATRQPAPLGIEGPSAMPALGYEGAPPSLGYGSTPTGTLRVGPDGRVVSETAADVTQDAEARRADLEQRDGLTAQAPVGGVPGSGVLVGQGALTPQPSLRERLEAARRTPATPLLTGPTDAAEPQIQSPTPVVERPGAGRAPDLGASVGPVPGVEATGTGSAVAAPALADSGSVVPAGSAIAESGEALREANRKRLSAYRAKPTADEIAAARAQTVTITPENDIALGVNDFGDMVYEVKDGYRGYPAGDRYTMRGDGRPNFGGIVVTAEEAAQERAERAEPAQSQPNPPPEGAALASGITSESGAELGTDIPTLKRQWQDAVRAGDGELAKRVNAQIVAVKKGEVKAQETQQAPAAAPAAAPYAPTPATTASWVIREKATGKVIMETFDRKKVDALNTAKYEAVPIREHLASLNRKPAESPPAAEAPDKPAPQTTNRPPKSFRKKHMVQTDVFVEESAKMEKREVDADSALKALDEDISELEAFLKCIKG